MIRPSLFGFLILFTKQLCYPKALLARTNTFLTLLIVFNLTMHIQEICPVPFLLIRHKPLPRLPGLRNGRCFFIWLDDRIHFTNDANAAAVGEMTYGAARGMKNFIMITLGTGVGSGIVINGEVVYGHDGFAGELGHVAAVRNNGRTCNCGKTGCLETYASATGVARTAREWLELSDEPSVLRSLDTIASKDVYEAAKDGDKLALKIFEFTGKILGRSFADFIAFSSPEAIVLFGGLARAKEFLLPPMESAMNENVLP